jgi:hypothetical protein
MTGIKSRIHVRKKTAAWKERRLLMHEILRSFKINDEKFIWLFCDTAVTSEVI